MIVAHCINFQYLTKSILSVDVTITTQYTIITPEPFRSFLPHKRCDVRIGRVKLDNAFGSVRYSIHAIIIIYLL